MGTSPRAARTNGRIGGLSYAVNTSQEELSGRGQHAFEARLRGLERRVDPEGKYPPDVRHRMARRRLRLEMTRLAAKRWRRHRRLKPVERPRPERLSHWALGERNPMARHSDERVREARALRAQGWDLRRIAAHIGVDHSTIGRWCRGETRQSAEVTP